MLGKRKIKLEVLEPSKRVYLQDLSIGEVAKRVRIAGSTASLWFRVLKADGKIEVSRRVGNAIFYRFKKEG